MRSQTSAKMRIDAGLSAGDVQEPRQSSSAESRSPLLRRPRRFELFAKRIGGEETIGLLALDVNLDRHARSLEFVTLRRHRVVA